MKEKELTYNVRKDIERRAKSANKSVAEYLKDADANYCVKLIGNTNILNNVGGILTDGEDYLVFWDKEGAEDEIDALFLKVNAIVVTETEAIEIMCQMECTTTYIGGYAIKQLPGGSLEIRSTAELNGNLLIEPVVSNVVKIHSNRLD